MILALVLSLGVFAPTLWSAERQVLHHHVPEVLKNLTAVGRMASTNRLSLAIGLPLRNPEALTNLLQQIYDPASPSFRHYLTPEQFTQRFGPTEQDYQTVIAFLNTNGLTVTGLHPNRMLLDIKASVTDVERTFHVTMRTYPHPRESRMFYAPDVEPSVDLLVPLLHISGMDNYALPHPLYSKRPLNQTGNATPNSGSGPSGSYMGNDFRVAYAPGTSLTGAGQSVGLLQFDGYYASDITRYINQAGIATSVILTNVAVDGGVGTPGSGVTEVSLDIEMVISMAPGLSRVIVYEAPNPSPWDDLLNRMANDNLARQLSCSWNGGAEDATADQIFQQMAAQGQSFFCASGDSDALSGAIAFPSDNPNITLVGGTTLTMSNLGAAWSSETVWNWGGGIGSSGGISTYYTIPTWQRGISMTASKGSTTMRNVPDVALTADNICVIYNNGNIDTNVGGTSCATPLWAGFLALVNQQAAANGQPPIGFLNPAVYAIGKGAGYTNCFHDITTGNNTRSGSSTTFYAVTGYDLCTGWGTPAGNNMINGLLNLDTQSLTVASFYGNVTPAVGTSQYNYGTSIRATVTQATVANGAATQYVCGGWIGTGSATNGSGTNTSFSLTNSSTLTWLWTTNYWLTLSKSGQGALNRTNGWNAAGSKNVITAAPSNHWQFQAWSGDTQGCAMVANVITAAMTQARSIAANFTINQETLTVASAYGGVNPGTLTTSWNTALSCYITNSPVTSGTTQYLANGGVVLSNVFTQVNATNITLTLTNNSTLTWRWVTNYWLAAGVGGAGGSVSLGANWYPMGTNVSITATASNGWLFRVWSGDTQGCVIVANVITAAMTQARSITANFVANTNSYDITATAGSGGSIEPLGTVWVGYGGATNFVITPDLHYHVTNVVVDGSSVGTPGNYSFVNVTNGGHTITASFGIDQYSLTIGSLYGVPVPLGTTTNGWNTQIAAWVSSPVTNGATTQYVCTGWTGTGSVTNGTGTNIAFNLTVNSTLNWLWKTQYLVTASAGANGSVTPTNAMWVDCGGVTAFYIATPNVGYVVDQWYASDLSVQTGGTNFSESGLTGPLSILVTFGQPVVMPTFSPDGGSFPDSFSVTVQCATPGATIFYSTTGVDPTTSDATVANGGTVFVTSSVTLKAKAWKLGMLASAVDTAVCTILDPRVSLDLPTNGAVFFKPSAVTVLVAAAGTFGVSAVDILAGTNWLGTTTNSPYRVVWSNAESGDYALTALARDTQGHVTTSMPVNVGVMSPLWRGASDLGDGWRWLNWFGYFAEIGNDWIFHLQHGWMYPVGTNSASLWLWTSDMDWLWTTATTYPYLYRNDDSAWLWYLAGSFNPRWFYNYKTSSWELH